MKSQGAYKEELERMQDALILDQHKKIAVKPIPVSTCASIARMATEELQQLQQKIAPIQDQIANKENVTMGAGAILSRMAKEKLKEIQGADKPYDFKPASNSSTLRKVRKGLKMVDQNT